MEKAKKDTFTGTANVSEQNASFQKNAKRIVAWYIDTIENLAKEGLILREKSANWAKDTPLAAIFEAQNSMAQQLVEKSASFARSILQLEKEEGKAREGELAPAFDSQMVFGEEVKPVKLSDFFGKKLVLYFYPKDNTPGCTKEACAFRDGFASYQQAGIAVLGCSVDSADAHKAFIKRYHLPFPLLLDPDHKIATAYGAPNGIPILGLDRRITYVIDENGKILKVYPLVDPAMHADEILSAFPAEKTTCRV